MEDGYYWDTGDVTVGVITGSHGWRALRYALARPRLWRNIPRVLRHWRAPVYRLPDHSFFLKAVLEMFPDDDYTIDYFETEL